MIPLNLNGIMTSFWKAEVDTPTYEVWTPENPFAAAGTKREIAREVELCWIQNRSQKFEELSYPGMIYS